MLRSCYLALILACCVPAIAQEITIERGPCFGLCPMYLLKIDSSGAVSFRRGPPSNRFQEQTSRITPTEFAGLMQQIDSIDFFKLMDLYEPFSTDGQSTELQVTLVDKSKKVRHFENGPSALRELERKIEALTNIHQWLHDDPRRFALNSPLSGSRMGGGEDLKNETFVRYDVYTRIKPGMTSLMQAAGHGEALSLDANTDLNAADETGWTALMIAAVIGQPKSITTLLDAGARIDQRDTHGNTALLGAAAVRFSDLRTVAATVRRLLSRRAGVNATNDLGETPLMWASRTGNAESVRALLDAGADPTMVDQSGHNALFYLRDARANLTFDPPTVQRYLQAESLLEPK